MLKNTVYQEEQSSTFQNGNKVYNLNKLFNLTHNEHTLKILVSKLDWIFDKENNLGDFDKNDKRTHAADYSVPILVATIDGQEVVVDGIHRLSKAIHDGEKNIAYKRVTQKMLDESKETLAKESIAVPLNTQETEPPFSSWV